MTTTPNLLLPNIEGSQSQKHVTHNAALQFLDMFVHAAVKDRDLASPPGSPSEGDRYLIAGSAAGVWSGHSGQIAGYYAGTWIFGIPVEGWRIWVMDEDIYLTYNGSAWAADSTSGTFNILGVNTTADATNKLSVSSSAILFNHIGSGVQVKLNKNTAGDSASFLYQTGWSGRAEIGTTGDDNFHFKVSPDGSSWKDALTIDKTTGAVSAPFSPLTKVLAASGAKIANTGNTTENTLVTVNVPANSLGPNGYLRVWTLWTTTGNTNSKAMRVKFGGTAFTSASHSTATALTASIVTIIQNRNATNAQIGCASGQPGIG